MTQSDMILKVLQQDGSITPLEAMRELGCMRLAARISDLRRMGYPITAIRETRENRFGRQVSYARYVLGGERQ